MKINRYIIRYYGRHVKAVKQIFGAKSVKEMKRDGENVIKSFKAFKVFKVEE